MKPHRTPLLANAVSGSVRSPAQGAVVPAAAYAAHTESSAPDDSDPRLTNSRKYTALRERLSQTRARIARAHAERPPQINLDWDAEEPLTRVYQGEKLPHPRSTYTREPSFESQHAQATSTEYAPSIHANADDHPFPRPAAADHASEPWYSDLRAHAAVTNHAPAKAQPPDAPGVFTRDHADAAIAAQRAHTTPTEHARATHAAIAAQHAYATPSHIERTAHAERPAQQPHSKRNDQERVESSDAPSARADARSFTRAPHTHAAQPNRTRTRAEQALTARVHVPVAKQTSSFAHEIPRESFLPPSAASDHIATHTARLTQAVTSTVNTLRERLGDAYANIDRSDTALRKRVTYCSLGLLIVAALSRIAFPGAASEAASNETSQAAATNAPALQNASVSISSDPPGALITLDGQTSHQATPTKLTELAPGRHTITLKLAGYAETKEALNLPADALVSIKLAALDEPRFTPEPAEQRSTLSRAEQRAQARELARERRAAARAAKVLLRYRARMGLPPDPVAQELVDAYGPTSSAE